MPRNFNSFPTTSDEAIEAGDASLQNEITELAAALGDTYESPNPTQEQETTQEAAAEDEPTGYEAFEISDEEYATTFAYDPADGGFLSNWNITKQALENNANSPEERTQRFQNFAVYKGGIAKGRTIKRIESYGPPGRTSDSYQRAKKHKRTIGRIIATTADHQFAAA